MAGSLTLAMIKPHTLFERKVGRIITHIEDSGFAIVMAAMKQLQREGAEEFYKEHAGKDFFQNLTRVMSSGPLWALVLSKPNAVEEWRTTIGSTEPSKAEPGTLRNLYGHHDNVTLNAVHGSATDFEAIREINFFFGRELHVAGRVLGLDKNAR